MMELVDILDLKSRAFGRPGSTPGAGTKLTSWNDEKLTLVGARFLINLTGV